MSIHDKIAKLPEWPETKWTGDDHDERYLQLMNYVAGERAALLARLALARELLTIVKESAIDRRGEDFNLTREQWVAFHKVLAAITQPGEKT
jgi:hypothetical protein